MTSYRLRHDFQGDQASTVLLTDLPVREMMEALVEYQLDGELDAYEHMDSCREGSVRRLVWKYRPLGDSFHRLLEKADNLAQRFQSPSA